VSHGRIGDHKGSHCGEIEKEREGLKDKIHGDRRSEQRFREVGRSVAQFSLFQAHGRWKYSWAIGRLNCLSELGGCHSASLGGLGSRRDSVIYRWKRLRIIGIKRRERADS
jgi:hypothetical protein